MDQEPAAAGQTIALLSLAGIPLTAGFIGKFYVVAAGVDQRLWLLLAAVVFGSAVGLFHYLRAMAQLYLREPWVRKYSAPQDWAQNTGGLMLLALVLLMVLLGVYPTPFIAVVQAAGLAGQYGAGRRVAKKPGDARLFCACHPPSAGSSTWPLVK